MDAETLDRLCREAIQRLQYHINRSASQHLRRMRESYQVIKPTETK
jgi:hypothetical protein